MCVMMWKIVEVSRGEAQQSCPELLKLLKVTQLFYIIIHVIIIIVIFSFNLFNNTPVLSYILLHSLKKMSVSAICFHS